MKRLIVASLLISLVLVSGISGCTTSQVSGECKVDSDCIPSSCCHPTSCMPASNVSACNLLCTQECVPGSLDCGQGSCSCNNGKCSAQFNECKSDSDCACGTDIQTGQCAFGPKANINVSKQCPDFCTGIDGKISTKCVSGKCSGVHS